MSTDTLDLRKMTVKEFCQVTNACSEGANWARQFPTMHAVWDALAAGQGKADWFFWLASRDGLADPNELRMISCKICRTTPLHDGRTTWDLMTDPRSRAAVEVAERYTRGEATDEELDAARSAARSAAWSAARSAARSAAWSDARSAARSAAWSDAADAARSAAWSDAADAARSAAWSAADKHNLSFFTQLPNPFPAQEPSEK